MKIITNLWGLVKRNKVKTAVVLAIGAGLGIGYGLLKKSTDAEQEEFDQLTEEEVNDDSEESDETEESND